MVGLFEVAQASCLYREKDLTGWKPVLPSETSIFIFAIEPFSVLQGGT